MTLNELISEIRGVFKIPKVKYYFGKVKFGTPYFNPRGYLSSVVKIRKLKYRSEEEVEDYAYRRPYLKNDSDVLYSNLPMVRRNNYIIKKLFGTAYYIEYGWPIVVHNVHWGWKDKYNTPRHEWAPSFIINFFGLQFCRYCLAPDGDRNDVYWEMILWYLFYQDKDIEKAERTWGWQDYKTKLTTWNKSYLDG